MHKLKRQTVSLSYLFNTYPFDLPDLWSRISLTSRILPTPLSLAKNMYMSFSFAWSGSLLTSIVQSSLYASSACLSIKNTHHSNQLLTRLLDLLSKGLLLSFDRVLNWLLIATLLLAFFTPTLWRRMPVLLVLMLMFVRPLFFVISVRWSRSRGSFFLSAITSVTLSKKLVSWRSWGWGESSWFGDFLFLL